MLLRQSLTILAISTMAVYSQTSVKSSIEFYDTTANEKTGEIGWIGNAASGSMFIETNGQKNLNLKKDTLTFNGQINAAKFSGDGSKLTNIAVDSINWNKIKDIPTGFADGIDNAGSAAADSVGKAKIADSTKTIPDGSVTSSKVAANAITDEKIDSVSWTKIRNKPAGIDSFTNAGADFFTHNENDGYEANIFAGSTMSIASVTITAPSSGIIILNSSASVYFLNSATSYVISGGIYTTPNKLGELDKGPATSIIGDLGKMYCWGMTRGFTVTSAGNYTYYLVFKNVTDSDIKVLTHTITGAFYPKRY